MNCVVGLTGPTGSGKSLAASFLARQGFSVIDCDKVCHDVYASNPLCRRALQEAFGHDVVAQEQVIRPLLVQRAFKDEESTERLNRTVLPFIVTEVLARIEAGGPLLLLDAPTLFESGLDEICHAVLVVTADDAVRCQRIMQRDGLTKEAALKRMKAGKPISYYTARTPHVLQNDGNPDAFETELIRMIQQVTKECLA